MRTREEVEKLKFEWKCDPCWDIYDTEGFEDYKDELKEYQKKCEKIWENQRMEEKAYQDANARSLGLEGLYQMILDLQNRLDFAEEIINEIPRLK